MPYAIYVKEYAMCVREKSLIWQYNTAIFPQGPLRPRLWTQTERERIQNMVLNSLNHRDK